MQSVELESLLRNTEFISQELSRIKDDVQKGRTNLNYPEENPLDYIERSIKLRQSFRALADGIEAKRSLAQLQKQKIEKSKNYLQGLQYYKTTLINKIKQSHIESLELREFYQKPLEFNNWINDYDLIQEHMKQELQLKEKQKHQLLQLSQQKKQKEDMGKNKRELYEKVLPEKAYKLYQEVMVTAKLCEIKEFEGISNIQNGKISTIYEKIIPLRVNETVEVTLSRQPVESLEITILNKNFQLFEVANDNKIPLNQKSIKLTITVLDPMTDQLVIGLDRREDYTNQEVFQRLVNNEVVKPVYEYPLNQKERNINKKYVKGKWLQDVLLTGLIPFLDLVDLVKERVFNLMMMGYLQESMKKITFFFPLANQEEQNGTSLPTNIRKAISGNLQKIQFAQFLQEIHIPSWVQKYRLRYSQLENQKYQMRFQDSQKMVVDKTNFLKVLDIFTAEELEEGSLNSYYLGNLTGYQNTLNFILIVPFSYPKRASKIVITNWQRKKQEENRVQGLQGLSCKGKVSNPNKMISDKILWLEREVNEEIFNFYKAQSPSFRILFQINRLISLLGMHAQKRL